MRGFTAGSATRSCMLTVSARRSAPSATPQPEPCHSRSLATAGALARTGLDTRIGRLAHHPTVALMAGLGPAGLGFLPLLLAIRRGWLGGGARGLLRPLQAQHQLDQLFLAQTLKLATTHATFESTKMTDLKGLGNYNSGAQTHAPNI